MHQRVFTVIAALFVMSVAAGGMAQASTACPGCTYVPLIRADGGPPFNTPLATITPFPTRTPSPTATPVPVTLLTNGDFEQGAVFWQPQAAANAAIITNPPSPVAPHSGTHVARLYAAQQDFVSAIDAVNVTVPINTPYLSYWVWVRSTELTCGDDLGGAGVSDTSPVVDKFNLCAATQTSGWVNRGLNLSVYAGQSVTIEILTGTFDTDTPDSFLFVDDVGWQPVP